MKNLQDIYDNLNINPAKILILDHIDSEAFILDGAKMHTKHSALIEIYTQLGFKKYIEHANYDGLEELLRPSSDAWPERNRLIIGIKNFMSLYQHGDKEMLKVLFSIFSSVASEWNNKQPNSFYIGIDA